MVFVPFRAHHVAGVASYLAPAQAVALEGAYAFTGMVGEEVAICGGAVEQWPGRHAVWSVIGRAACGHWKSIHKGVREFIATVKVRRLEMNVACGDAAAHRWARHLGFTLETERMRGFFPDGTDAAMYVLVREG